MYMDSYGNICCEVQDYDSNKDSSGNLSGHTWKNAYLYYDGNEFKEYGALQISKSQFRKIEGGSEYLDAVTKNIKEAYSNYDSLKYEFFFRGNGIVQIRCDVYDSDGSIDYGSYEGKYQYGSIQYTNTERIPGIIRNRISSFDVTYPDWEYIE